MNLVIIVEGKNDRSRLRKYISDEIEILCTYGTPNDERIQRLKKIVGSRDVIIFTDHDASGRKIRKQLVDAFPDAEHLYTKKGYAGVEGTPEEHILKQLEKAELDPYIIEPEPKII